MNRIQKLFSRSGIAFALLVWCATSIPFVSSQVPGPPQLDARSWILADANSGYIIAGNDVDSRIEPASMTKIMTAFVIGAQLERGIISLDEVALVSEKAWKTEGSRMFLKPAARWMSMLCFMG